jgi:hypothetical protein
MLEYKFRYDCFSSKYIPYSIPITSAQEIFLRELMLLLLLLLLLPFAVLG